MLYFTSVSIVGRNRDRIVWKFYYDPQVFKSLGRGTHEKKISGGDHYDVNISHDRFESAYDDSVCCSQKQQVKQETKKLEEQSRKMQQEIKDLDEKNDKEQ